MSRRPLRAASLAFVGGVGLGGWLPQEPAAWGWAALATLACAAALLGAGRRAGAFRAALVLFGCAGIFRVQAELRPFFEGVPALAEGDAVVAGRVARPVEVRQGEGVLHLEDVRLRRDGATVRLARPLQVVVAGGAPPLAAGDLVTARGRLRAIRGDRNLGWFPGPVAPARRRYAGRLVVASAAWLRRDGSHRGSGPSAAVLRWRAAAHASWSAEPGASGGVLDALTTGERSGIPAETEEAFRRSGLAHVLAISGMNVAFLGALVFVALRRLLALSEALGLRGPVQPVAAALTLPALWFFMLFSGSDVPVARAVASGALGLAAVVLWRRSDAADAWALAALVLVAADPFVLFSPSFQLSFAAVGALLLVAPRLAPAPGGDGAPARRAERWYRRARSLFVASAAASGATAPLVAFHFQQVSLAGPVANLVAVPLAGFVVLPAGWAALGARAAGAPGADVLARAALWSGERLIDVAAWFATPSWAAVRTCRPSPLLTLALLALAATLARGRGGWTWTRFAACAVAAGAATAGALATHWPTGLVTFLDVGQGLAVSAVLPGGASLLYDAGPRWRGYDAGERVVAPALRRLGVGTVDVLVVSHAHPDHDGGVDAVRRELRVGKLWRGAGAGSPRCGTERRVAGGVRLRILGPRPDDGGTRGGDENDRSLALLVALGDTGVVLTGDTGPVAAGAVVANLADAPARVALQAPHHGGSVAACTLLATAIRPEVSVISVGRNTYGHPRAGAIAALGAAGDVARTDVDGAVHVRMDGRTLRVRTWREMARRRSWPERIRWLVAGW